MKRAAVLFVCLGNICRSPLAEAAFRREAQRRGLEVEIDSAGTGSWHVGHPPDRRAQAVALRHGIDISGYRGRQATPDDFRRFTHIVALDRANLADLQGLRPADATAELLLLLDAVEGRQGKSVADPYYGDDADFDLTWADAVAGAKGLADLIEGQFQSRSSGRSPG
ncbi:low molecular weight protein-tyrosine-phosphatase [Caulobacter sp. BK020]|uniref:low molecular weight protein-tyrosine-phosphatase n=1 Tax=Caulobacter sp. BK020 TaxID=2512117 RepID=UPI0010E1378D|nr:low molecular weight protein-tyrosine-phosphatase [Caulobacter sp. BK020]TCS18390.1 protein-tyrosine phosphatase [Caulobacter sp. BK020]